MTATVVEFLVPGPGSERLDKALVAKLPEYSRTRLQALIKDGFVSVGGQTAAKGGQLVEPGQVVRIELPPPQSTDLIPEAIPLDIIFENPDVIVINKPAGMVVHPSVGHFSGTLVHAVLAHIPDLQGIGGEQRPGIVHRLDKDTSGLILIAKNDLAHRWLQDQFRSRKVEKVYLALVDGVPPTPEGRIEAAISRDPAKRKRMAVVSPGRGRDSTTEYRTLETFPAHTFIEAHPHTGRTHQIRLHLAFLGTPIVGDTVYGRKNPTLPLSRHFLHAASLTIQLLGESNPRTFNAPLPEDLDQILHTLRPR